MRSSVRPPSVSTSTASRSARRSARTSRPSTPPPKWGVRPSCSSSRPGASCWLWTGSTTPSAPTASKPSVSTAAPASASASSERAPIAPARCWQWRRARRRRTNGPVRPPLSYASRPMRLSSKARRQTMLSFQPPAVGEEEIDAVAEAIRSGWLTTGPRAAELERRLGEYLEAEHVLAVASGTAALHLSLLALGVGPGDEVITSTITWPATANVIVHAGATPVFADVRESDLNIDPAHVAELVTDKTKALIPVHLAGQPCDMDPLLELGVPVVEDAAHAAESQYRERKIGTLSEATCFSLYATKNIAAGEGGLISTNSGEVAEAIDNLRIMRRATGSLYDIVVPGYKANLSDVLAAIALVQLGKVERHREIRERQFAAYDAALADLDGLETLARDARDTHA